jgi:hypothetical protein
VEIVRNLINFYKHSNVRGEEEGAYFRKEKVK